MYVYLAFLFAFFFKDTSQYYTKIFEITQFLINLLCMWAFVRICLAILRHLFWKFSFVVTIISNNLLRTFN